MADRTIETWTPEQGACKTSTFPAPSRSSDASGARRTLLFDAGADEAAYFDFKAPQGLTTPLKMVATISMVSATSGNVIVDGTLEAVTPGDSTDLDAGESLDTANASGAEAAPGTAGYTKDITVTLTNNDGIAAGDLCRLRFRRVGSNGADTATGDMVLHSLELRDDGL